MLVKRNARHLVGKLSRVVQMVSTAKTGYFYTTERLHVGPRLMEVRYDPVLKNRGLRATMVAVHVDKWPKITSYFSPNQSNPLYAFPSLGVPKISISSPFTLHPADFTGRTIILPLVPPGPLHPTISGQDDLRKCAGTHLLYLMQITIERSSVWPGYQVPNPKSLVLRCVRKLA
ncbi:hypothetical protein A0H81_11319 [Grifola frondosa]|uniref:Uncharacterized protein n=1 Tax=Grifola frondosa TaxID=5627 RepID=A0A1C7LXI4_GRIFR|nr:hypothetical protein A0H81_11319 [Grifola frondosa]